ncbi:hypothetical protein [Sutcliffiella horikoshii]|uniref:hypothetical protein n=1 Tax=Sutcliffiella horikoshii TaxID=79883 RepID=UPI003CEC3D5C
MDPNGELFRAKQQIIYYRSEVASSKNRIIELERLIDKEIVRNEYLKAKIRELNSKKIAGYVSEIIELRKRVMELEVEMEEERSFQQGFEQKASSLKGEKDEGQQDIYSYFHYSVILPPEGDDTISIYGEFTIVNSGDFPLEDVLVCFKVEPIGAVSLSAKIMDPKLLSGPGGDREDIEWVWAEEDWRRRIQTNGEYRIKTHKTSTYTNNLLSIKQIEINVNRKQISKYMTVSGSVHLKSQEIKSKNFIRISCL